jgi:hypothetical protein
VSRLSLPTTARGVVKNLVFILRLEEGVDARWKAKERNGIWPDGTRHR